MERKGPLSYLVEIEGGVVRRHIDQIRKDARSVVEERTAVADNVYPGLEPSAGDEASDAVLQEVVERPAEARVTTREVTTEESLSEAVVGEGLDGVSTTEVQPRSIAQDRPRRERNQPRWMGDYE